MVRDNIFNLPIGLLPLLASTALANQLYNPAHVLLSQNGSTAYLFSPQPSSQSQLSYLDFSDTIQAANPPITTLPGILPFQSGSSEAFIPMMDDGGDLTLLSGDCSQGADASHLWRF